MSDPVLIAIIVGIPACISAVTGMLNSFAIARGNRHIVETKRSMDTLGQHTNSMADALLKVTGESEFAKGLKQGSEERTDKGERV